LTTVPRPLLVAIVDESPIICLGVAALLKPFEHRVRVEAFAGSLLRRGSVDVLLYDPFVRPNTLERLHEIARETGAQVLAFAWEAEDVQIADAVRAGATGFLSKTVDGAAMVIALERAAAGRVAGDVRTAGEIPRVLWPGESEGLNSRESVIVSLIVAGMSNEDIASASYLSRTTVKNSIRTAYLKMGVANRAQAVMWGIDHGFEIASPAGSSAQR
jgi:NarL family two-component system response regulator LiaR